MTENQQQIQATMADAYREVVERHPENTPPDAKRPYVTYVLGGLSVPDVLRMVRDRYPALSVNIRFGVDPESDINWTVVPMAPDAVAYSKFLIDAPAASGMFSLKLTSGTLDIEVVRVIARLCVCTTDAVYSNACSDLITLLDTIVGKAPLYELAFWPGVKVEDHEQSGVGCIIVNGRDLVELGKPEPKAPELPDTTTQPVQGDLQLHAHCECGANVYVPVNPLQLLGPIDTECGACGRHMTITYANPN